MRLITIKESHYTQDLLVLKSILESEGIPCFLKNEHTTTVMSHMATFVTELQVTEEFLVQALEIMKETKERA